MSLNGTDTENGSTHVESFHKPLFEAFGMFLGMVLALVMHWAVMIFKLDFPGYDFINEEKVQYDKGVLDHHEATYDSKPPNSSVSMHSTNDEEGCHIQNNGAEHPEKASKPKSSNTLIVPKTTSIQIYFILAIPAILDLIATAMFMVGLQYLDVSIHQILRGSQIIFVALLKQYILKNQLLTFHWVGVSWNVVSVVLVGVAALLVGDGGEEGSKDVLTKPVLGVCLTISGAFAQASETVSIEYIMMMDDYIPPLLMVGMLGMYVNITWILNSKSVIQLKSCLNCES